MAGVSAEAAALPTFTDNDLWYSTDVEAERAWLTADTERMAYLDGVLAENQGLASSTDGGHEAVQRARRRLRASWSPAARSLRAVLAV